MEIFRYVPNASAVARRLHSFVPDPEEEPSTKLALEGLVFKHRERTREDAKKKAVVVCSNCQEEGHPSYKCTRRVEKREAPEQASNVYSVRSILTPTSIRIINVPKETQKYEMRELLDHKFRLRFDMFNFVNDKITGEFRGVVFVNFPTVEEAEKAVDLIDGHRMDVNVLSAEVVDRDRNR